MDSLRAFALALFALAFASVARAEVVDIDGARALVEAPASPRASIILLPGGDGRLGITADGQITALRGNQLIRTRGAYVRAGFAVLTADAGVGVARAIEYMRQRFRRPVIVVATSRGTLKVLDALAGRPNGLVLTSGFLAEVQSRVGNPAALPPTLIVHHRQDGCRLTTPAAVEPFKAWGGPRVTVRWLDGGNGDPSDLCNASGYHGFAGLDGVVVGTVARFARSVR